MGAGKSSPMDIGVKAKGTLAALARMAGLPKHEVRQLARREFFDKLSARKQSAGLALGGAGLMPDIMWPPGLTLSDDNANGNVDELQKPCIFRFGRDASEMSSAVEEVDAPATTFADVIGHASAKDLLHDFLEARRNPERYARLGARPPAGALLHGPPGTGKTMLARALAKEARMDFIAASGSEFIKVYGGSGPKGVRDLFNSAREKRPCIVFIDEIDSCGAKRVQYTGDDGIFLTQAQERDNTLNQLLHEMDGFVAEPDIVTIAATNRLDVLDPALTRAGRFDRKIPIETPDVDTRVLIFAHYAKRLLLAPECDVDAIAEAVARATTGQSGADMRLIANEAALIAARAKAEAVNMKHIELACDMVTAEGNFEKALELGKILSNANDEN
jgi:ATP-dependent Zn protease